MIQHSCIITNLWHPTNCRVREHHQQSIWIWLVNHSATHLFRRWTMNMLSINANVPWAVGLYTVDFCIVPVRTSMEHEHVLHKKWSIKSSRQHLRCRSDCATVCSSSLLLNESLVKEDTKICIKNVSRWGKLFWSIRPSYFTSIKFKRTTVCTADVFF